LALSRCLAFVTDEGEIPGCTKIVAPYEKMGYLFAQSGNFFTPEAKKFTGPEQYPWWVRKMVSLLFLKKVNKGFEDFAKSWGCTRPLNDKPYVQ